MNDAFWHGKSVLITGHTGFKGSWLAMWLSRLGAKVIGYSTPPPTTPSNYYTSRVNELVHSIEADICDLEDLNRCIRKHQPEVIFHLAAQSLVRQSYEEPLEAFQTNIIGTANVLEAVRLCPSAKSVIIVTSDKCYDNKEWIWGYRENEPLGGDDPYSSSKGCAELVAASYRNSFFNPGTYHQHGVGLATVRAGNVIGGGDWSKDRLIPDALNAYTLGEELVIRNPTAVRPWQFVLEPLQGYMILAEQLHINGEFFSEAWNFGPNMSDALPVELLVKRLSTYLKSGIQYRVDPVETLHEATTLKLDCTKAATKLNWHPRTTIDDTLHLIADWYNQLHSKCDMQKACIDQIETYQSLTRDQ